MDDVDLDLDFNPVPLGRGRRPQRAVVSAKRSLVEADVVALNTAGSIPAKPLQELSDRHHALARLIATGMRPSDAALQLGYTTARVSIFLKDRLFKELLRFYREDVVNPQFDALLEHLAGMSVDASLEIRRRLENGELREDMTVAQLLEIIKTGADRTGRGSSSQVNHNYVVDMGAKLAAARERAKRQLEVEDAVVIPSEKTKDA